MKISPFFIRHFPIASLQELSSSFRIYSVNKSEEPYGIFVSSFKNGEMKDRRPKYLKSAGSNEPLIISNLEFAELNRSSSDIYLVHCVPEKYIGKTPSSLTTDELVELSHEQIFHHMAGPDWFVEYLDESDLPQMSVGYHGLIWNMNERDPKDCALIQGAKCFIDKHRDTYILALNVASRFDYKREAKIDFRITNCTGVTVEFGSLNVKPFSYVLHKLGSSLPRDESDIYNLIAVCADASLVPFILVKDSRSGSMFLEHGIVPSSHLFGYTAIAKRQAIETWKTAIRKNNEHASGSL